MGRRRVLSFGTTVLNNLTFYTASWGPFSGAVRIKAFYVKLGSTGGQNGTIGLYSAPSPDAPFGALTVPAAIPNGWTSLIDSFDIEIGGGTDSRILQFPWGTPTPDSVWSHPFFEIDVTGQLFYLKVWCNNRTGAATDPAGFLCIEENPEDLQGLVIDVRPTGGTEEPAPTPVPVPMLPPPPLPPVLPPPAGLPSPTLPAPGPQTIPAITIDPVNPEPSVREIVSR